jgi:multiple sugar transport system substrate-binding protein
MRSTMQRGVAATVAASLALGLAGFGGVANAKSGPTINITFATFFSVRYAVIQKIAQQFERLHPNIHITLEHESGTTNMLTKLLTELAAGTGPNIASMFGPWAAELASNPDVLPLNGFIRQYHYNLNQFYPDNNATDTVNGKVIALPADNDNLMVYYNKTLFEKYHVPFPKPNWTWAQMIADAKALNHPAEKNYGFLMFLGNTEGVTWRWWCFLWQAGGQISNPQHTKVLFDSPAGIKAMNFYLQLERYSDLSPRSEYEAPFESGHVAMTISGSWMPSTFTADHINYGVVPLPAPYPGGPHTSIAGPDLNIILKSSPAQEKASWLFLTYLEDRNSEAMMASLGHLPFRPDVLSTPQYRAMLKKYPVELQFAQNARWTRIRPKFAQYAEVSLDVGNAIEAVLLHKETPAQALKQAAQQADQQLSQPAP